MESFLRLTAVSREMHANKKQGSQWERCMSLRVSVLTERAVRDISCGLSTYGTEIAVINEDATAVFCHDDGHKASPQHPFVLVTPYRGLNITS